MQSCYLLLVLAVAAVNSKVVNINHVIDIGAAKLNEHLRQTKYTSFDLPAGSFGNNVSFSDSQVIGIDSLKRTGDCTSEIVGKDVKVDLHYGLGLFQQSFKYLEINGQGMSASYRVRDNSVRLHYTVHNIFKQSARCYVTLHDLYYERLAKVDFYSSRTEFDGINLEDYFKQEIIPYLNSLVNKSLIEEGLTSYMCKNQHLELSQQIPMSFKFIRLYTAEISLKLPLRHKS